MESKICQHISNLFENVPAISLHAKIQTCLTGKPSPSFPQCCPAHRAQAVLKLTVSWCLWFYNHKVLAWSAFVWGFVQKIYLWPMAEVLFPLSSLSGYWEAPSVSTSVNYFLLACHLAVTSTGSTDLVTVHFQTGLEFKLTQIIPR